MNANSSKPETQGPAGSASIIVEREKGLARQLSTRQLTMIAIGGTIGTGLFLGSSLAVRIAGPAVLLTYCAGALIAVLLMGVLSEMAVAHPAAGRSASMRKYTCPAGPASRSATPTGRPRPSPLAGKLPRWRSTALVVSRGAGLGVDRGVLRDSAVCERRSVGSFGEFEYWFAMVKVVAILLFIAFGALVLAGFVRGAPHVGLRNFTSHGGFLANGIGGAWMALVFVIFGYIGTEVVAVAAGEAKDPEQSVPGPSGRWSCASLSFTSGPCLCWSVLSPGPRCSPVLTLLPARLCACFS